MEIKHKWVRLPQGWAVECLKHEKSFNCKIWDSNKGLCPYCEENAKIELEERKRARMKSEDLEKKEQRALKDFGFPIWY